MLESRVQSASPRGKHDSKDRLTNEKAATNCMTKKPNKTMKSERRRSHPCNGTTLPWMQQSFINSWTPADCWKFSPNTRLPPVFEEHSRPAIENGEEDESILQLPVSGKLTVANHCTSKSDIFATLEASTKKLSRLPSYNVFSVFTIKFVDRA